MNRPLYRLNITGKNSNEIYTLSFPDNLIRFISYDFDHFAEKSVELCRASMKKGEISRDDVTVLRNSLTPCHRYLEKNIHGIFEKIVLDCWIEYICRQNDINTSTLWNSFSRCRNEFETALFSRLCEYRYNRAVNRWTNLLKIQEYAKRKTEFIFGVKLESHGAAVAKAGYFDLFFNVTANEMGYGDSSVNRVYAELRTPNSPFVMSGVSREIMRNVLSGVNLEDGTHESTANHLAQNADELAMDAFEVIKNLIPEESDNIVNTIMKSIPKTTQRVYIPEGFKSVIDLEIDALLENGAIIQKCLRCFKYFLKDEEYNHDYCSRVENGRTCLSVMGEKFIKKEALPPVDATVLQSRCDQLYKEMSLRVNVDINQRDFSDWYKYLVLIRDNVIDGRASMDDFENFAEYSRSISFINRAQSQPHISEQESKKHKSKASSLIAFDDSGREIRSFEFEKVERTPAPKLNQPSIAAPADRTFSNSISPPPSPMTYALPSTTPIAYAPPTKTARVIRGVVPMGVKELSQYNQPQEVVVAEVAPKVSEMSKSDTLPKVEEVSKFVNEDYSELLSSEIRKVQKVHKAQEISEEIVETEKVDIDKDKFVEAFKTVSAPRSNKNNKNKKPSKPATKNKIKKPGLLQSPFIDVPENPYIRDLLNTDTQPVDVDLMPKAKLKDSPKGNPKDLPLLRIETPPKDVSNDTLSGIHLDTPPNPKDNSDDFLMEIPPAAPQLDFNSILSGIQRNDGFEKSKPLFQGDGEVTSHKTGRVMDAVFGKSKIINPFVKNDEKRESDE